MSKHNTLICLVDANTGNPVATWEEEDYFGFGPAQGARIKPPTGDTTFVVEGPVDLRVARRDSDVNRLTIPVHRV